MKPTKQLIKHFFPTPPTTLPGTEHEPRCSAIFQNDSGHVKDTRWNAVVKKHSTSYFSGTGKRQGLVVVSGMALGAFRGNVKGYIVWISISLHRNTFNFSQVAGTKQSWCRWCFCGENHRQQMSQVRCLNRFHQQRVKVHYGEHFTGTKMWY